MKAYVELGNRILAEGNVRGDRTGTGTKSIFGPQFEVNLQDGFPLLTTKRVFTKGIIHELLWFLKGSTDNNELAEEGVHIWDEWALKEDHTETHLYTLDERCSLLAHKLELSVNETADILNGKDSEHEKGFPHGGLKYLEENEIPISYEKLLVPAGALGPIYGKQWVNWQKPNGATVNQIQELIDGLKNKPFSRRHLVSAWNVSDLPDESISSQDNVKVRKMALAPCHVLFQFYVTELSFEARHEILLDKFPQFKNLIDSSSNDEELEILLNNNDVPKYKLSCKLFQR